MKSLKFNFLTLIFIALGVILFNSCSEDEAQPTHGSEDEVQSSQLLKNSNVERGSAVPDNWSHSTDRDNYNLTWTDQESFSGSKSLKISAETAHASEFAYWVQTSTANPPTGKAITLRANIKGDLKGEGVSIVIRGDPSAYPDQFATTENNLSISGVFDWKNYSVKLDNIDSSTQSLTVFLVYLPNTIGEVYFDDISLDH